MATVKEAVYDSQIAPLMDQILSICKEHKIAVLCDFALGCEEGEESQLKCTSALLGEEYESPSEMHAALKLLGPKRSSFVAMTISNGGL